MNRLYRALNALIQPFLTEEAFPVRICSCGKHHPLIPTHARYLADDELSGWYWECTCGSTLFLQDKRRAA
jgi:hypothetical protein